VSKTKTCSACHEPKSLAEFYNDRSKKDGLASSCKPCSSEHSRLWKESNPERARERARKWRAANPEKNHENYLQWRTEDPERYRKQKYNAVHRTRALKAGGEVDESLDIFTVFEEENYICGICGDAIDPFLRNRHPEMATIDHIIPLSKGGSHTRDNVQTAHLSCNVKKEHAHVS
jgi:hypothetical protein